MDIKTLIDETKKRYEEFFAPQDDTYYNGRLIDIFTFPQKNRTEQTLTIVFLMQVKTRMVLGRTLVELVACDKAKWPFGNENPIEMDQRILCEKVLALHNEMLIPFDSPESCQVLFWDGFKNCFQ